MDDEEALSSDDEILIREIQILKSHVAKTEEPSVVDPFESTDVNDPTDILKIPAEKIAATPENILSLNGAAISVLLQLLRNVTMNLERNRKEQDAITSYIENSKQSNCSENKRLYFYICGVPFFKDADGLSQPNNCDTLLRKSIGHISVKEFICPPHPWTSADSKRLQEIVENHSREKALEKIENEVALLKKAKDNEALQNALQRVSALRAGAAVEINPSNVDWQRVVISLEKFSFTADECEALWVEVLDKNFNLLPWTKEEIKKLEKLSEEHFFQNWPKVASELGTNRSPLNCFLRYKTNKNFKIGYWDKAEEEKLLHLVSISTIGNQILWPRVVYYFENRSRLQLRNHYMSISCTSKGRFTLDEDKTLLNVVDAYNGDMSMAQQFLPQRTKQTLLRRLKILLNETSFTAEEDRTLFQLIKYHGLEWSAITKAFPGRCSWEIKRRYMYLMFSSKNRRSTEITAPTGSEYQIIRKPLRPKVQKIYFGLSLHQKVSVNMMKLLAMFEYGHSHLFGPRITIPRTEPEKQNVVERISLLSKMLSINCDFQNVRQWPPLPAAVENVKQFCEALHDLPAPNWPTVTSRCFIPPNQYTILGHRVLLSAKGFLFSQSENGVRSEAVECESDVDRLNFKEAKDLLRSRMFSLFFIPALLSRIPREPETLLQKSKRKKSAPGSKLSLKKRMKIMSETRWKPAKQSRKRKSRKQVTE